MVENPDKDTPATESEATETKQQPKRRRWLWLLLALLSVILAVNLIATIYYLVTKKSLYTMPGVSAITYNTPPRFIFAIYDVAKPVGVAVSPDGQRVYVTEGGDERQVRIFDPNGRSLGFLSPPNTEAGTRIPMYVAVDGKGRVFVTDGFSNSVRMYSPAGEYLGELPPPPNAGSWAPLGVAVDRRGQLYLTVAGTDQRHRVVVYDDQLNFKFEFGSEGREPGQFSFPNALAVDDQGRMFVSNSNNSRVDVFGPDGKYLADYAKRSNLGGQGLPRGIGIDDQNRLHVVDTVNHVVTVYGLARPQSEPLFSFGTFGVGDGQFRFPNGLAIDQGGRVYVTDRENNRVQVWAY